MQRHASIIRRGIHSISTHNPFHCHNRHYQQQLQQYLYLYSQRRSLLALARRSHIQHYSTSSDHQPRTHFALPFLTQPEEEEQDLEERKKYPRKTASDISHLTQPPTRTNMLVRDFIDDSLYNPNYGYFSKQAVIFSPEIDFDFNEMRDHLEFMNILARMYRDIEGDADEVDEIARQVWHTPTELFKPWYGYAIAKYMVSEYKLNLYPHKDLIIYEMGAGNGTLMMNILDYIQQYEPSVYKRTQYNIIEISGKLAERQSERQDVRDLKDQHQCVKIINKSIFDWDTYVPDQCFFLGMEVIDNFAHDLIRYDIETLKPYQGLVSIDSKGDYTELYEPVGKDALINRYLTTRKQTRYRSPVLANSFWYKLLTSLPLAPNLTAPEFIPTKLFLFMETLKEYFPQHRLVLSDFSSLPDAVPGVDAPVVQTRYKGTMVPCSTYMVQPGWFDIFFPTNWELFRDMYLLVCRGSRAGSDRNVKVMTHREFCERYGEVERTTTRSGENPMLMYYENMKMLVT
ncbi:S-adenosyl-L-methionine-dependent methyltransferase [Halteromyces radiatus]|uniref:S-adenosyl-L-methionine-dependent methyltransferase n=1 Tax=Halteromyces radiatus TaxID=101107 RepID=UPI00221EEEDB|nr:S-adenosyl-L-methionine-dependent methyltransferase [Halteromyces radiatus]KAI8097411.1 S-adenosyl-L-methionine-dependent methyltransferase [Halteromyces radiatus]